MRKIVVLACLVAVAFAGITELAFESYSGNYKSGNSGFQRYTKSEWDTSLDFGVYFWFKIDSRFPTPGWSTLFTLTSNTDNVLRDGAIVGDRILSSFIRTSQISSCSSTPGNGNVYHIYNYDTKKDVDSWAFYYQAYSGSLKRLTTMVQMPNSYIIDKIDKIVHQPSTYYKLIWGQSFSYGYFPGTMAKFVIQGGGNIYRETNWDDLINQFNPAKFDSTVIPSTYNSVNSNSQSELAADQYVGDNKSGNAGFKRYTKTVWANELEFGVYFWFKIDSKYQRPNWATLFTLTANPENTLQDAVKMGDRVLSAFIRTNQISSCTSTTGNGNANHIFNFDTKKDVDKWAFYYQAYSPSLQRLVTFIQMDYSYIVDKLDKIVHQPSDYYKLSWGQTFNYAYFAGAIQKIVVQGGGGIYRESNWNDLSGKYNPSNPIPTPLPAVDNTNSNPNCILIYYQENYQGTPINACTNVNNLNIRQIRSISVPKGYSIDLYDQQNYQGKFTRVSQSYTNFPPLDQLVWQVKTSFSQKKLTKNISAGKNYKRRAIPLI